MENTNVIAKYELVIILDAFLAEDAKAEIVKSAGDSITKLGGKMINSQVWLPKQKLTFAIKKCSEGTYYLINFEGDTAIVEKINTQLKLNEKILRTAVIRA